MARFRTVEVYPYGGHADAPWTPDAETDAFARTARRVCEAYSRALALQDLHGKNSTLLLQLDTTPELDHVHVLVHTDYWEGHAHAGVSLPTGIATLTPQARARLVLDVVHGPCLRLAQARSMDATRLDHVRDAVLADGLRFVWTSSTKTSPDRRHLAQAHFELADDGFGRARILVRRRTDGQLVAVSDEQLAYSSSEGFARAAKTLRWQGSRRLKLTPYSDWLGRTRNSMLVVLPGPSPTSEAAAGVAEPTPMVMPVLMPAVEAAADDPYRPRVVVEGRGADAPEGNDFPQRIQGGARFFVRLRPVRLRTVPGRHGGGDGCGTRVEPAVATSRRAWSRPRGARPGSRRGRRVAHGLACTGGGDDAAVQGPRRGAVPDDSLSTGRAHGGHGPMGPSRPRPGHHQASDPLQAGSATRAPPA